MAPCASPVFSAWDALTSYGLATEQKADCLDYICEEYPFMMSGNSFKIPVAFLWRNMVSHPILYFVFFSDLKKKLQLNGEANIRNPFPVGSTPFGIAFDSANGNLYITNRGDNTVSVIRPAHSTTLTINPISNVPSGGTVTVTGKLTDNEMSNAGIGGKTITFTGTGAANISSVTTNPDVHLPLRAQRIMQLTQDGLYKRTLPVMVRMKLPTLLYKPTILLVQHCQILQ